MPALCVNALGNRIVSYVEFLAIIAYNIETFHMAKCNSMLRGAMGASTGKEDLT